MGMKLPRAHRDPAGRRRHREVGEDLLQPARPGHSTFCDRTAIGSGFLDLDAEPSSRSYLVIALIVLLLTIFKSNVAPQVYQAFMLSGLGWLAGAFAAVKPPA